jgi:hypothetical protein
MGQSYGLTPLMTPLTFDFDGCAPQSDWFLVQLKAAGKSWIAGILACAFAGRPSRSSCWRRDAARTRRRDGDATMGWGGLLI